jgi:hypothetical protein
MKKILPLLLLLACSSKEKIESPAPPNMVDGEDKKEVVIYEGLLRLHGEVVNAELSLEQGENGMEAGFSLTAGGYDWTNKRVDRGRYTILYGDANSENKFELHGQLLSFLQIKDSPRTKPELKDITLHFISDGDQKLISTDEDFDPITDDGSLTLYKRSRLITVEGYLTCESNRTELFEQHTSEKWNVATLGVWKNAKEKYDSIATEKFEGVYLKAVAYWILSDSTDEDLLVIKNILDMRKSKSYQKESR